MEQVECCVIGAGVVGLAVARALAQRGMDVVILESEGRFGSGISARNSEVLHAGMYYAPGSLKAQFCVTGNRLLRDYLPRHHIAHHLVGKLIVATTADEDAALEGILQRAAANGVPGLRRIPAAEAMALEPALSCVGALFSETTGILDAHGLMLSLLGDAEADGAMLALNSPVQGGQIVDTGVVVQVGGAEPMQLHCQKLVIAAGLGAQAVAQWIEGYPAAAIPPLSLCKGNYFRLDGRQPFQRLIYPVPVAAGLGVHYTLDLGGQGRFGPDVEWIEHEDYTVDPKRGDSFYAAIRRYWPGLPDQALQPAYAGIRPKPHRRGDPAVDFRLDDQTVHGLAGVVALFGIESPGLTSCLAIAEAVAERLA